MRHFSAVALAFLMLAPGAACAQAVPARQYLNTPVGAARWFLNLNSTAATSGGESAEDPLPNNESLAGTGYVTILYSFPFAGRYAGVALAGGKGSVSGTGPSGNISASGFTDPSLTVHLNFFGGPALRAEQYKSFVPQTFSTLHIVVSPPLGSYNANTPVNMGSNRWTTTATVNLSATADRGVSWTELYVASSVFSDNNAFQSGNQFAERPLTTLTAHYSHNIGRGTYAAVGLYYNLGGESYVNGIAQNDALHSLNPTASISTLIGALRMTLRYNNTSPTPNSPGANAMIGIQTSAPLF